MQQFNLVQRMTMPIVSVKGRVNPSGSEGNAQWRAAASRRAPTKVPTATPWAATRTRDLGCALARALGGTFRPAIFCRSGKVSITPLFSEAIFAAFCLGENGDNWSLDLEPPSVRFMSKNHATVYLAIRLHRTVPSDNSM
jgi:hypothetical protein